MLSDVFKELLQKKLFVEPDGIALNINNSAYSGNVLALSGPNASGKSILCRMIVKGAKEEGCLVRETSMGDRARKGYMEQVRTFGRYGDEDRESTGNLTATRLMKDVDNLVESDKDFVMLVDEPEIGLSMDYHKALGEFLAQAYGRLNETGRCKGFIISSHSKVVFKAFLSNIKDKGLRVRTGVESAMPFNKWMNEDSRDKTRAEFMVLPSKAKERRKAIGQYLINIKEKRGPGDF